MSSIKVSAIIVTRGDVDLGPVLAPIDADEIIIRRGNGGVWERWEAARWAKHDVIYVQDDDCVVDFAGVAAAYDPAVVTCNMLTAHRGDYPDGIALVGWGSVFHASKLDVLQKWDRDEVFLRECDRVFTGLNALKLIDLGVKHLPHAYGVDRMAREARHGADLAEIRRRIQKVRNG
jgi:hypothetical protein